MIIPEPDEKSVTVKSPLRDEGSAVPDQVRATIDLLILSNLTHSIYLYTLRRALPHIALFPKRHLQSLYHL